LCTRKENPVGLIVRFLDGGSVPAPYSFETEHVNKT